VLFVNLTEVEWGQVRTGGTRAAEEEEEAEG
jgi:hypothetical protein